MSEAPPYNYAALEADFRVALKQLEGEVLRENAAMLAMARELGFARTDHHDDKHLVRVVLALAPLLHECTA